jgi:hypothetical protein
MRSRYFIKTTIFSCFIHTTEIPASDRKSMQLNILRLEREKSFITQFPLECSFIIDKTIWEEKNGCKLIIGNAKEANTFEFSIILTQAKLWLVS